MWQSSLGRLSVRLNITWKHLLTSNSACTVFDKMSEGWFSHDACDNVILIVCYWLQSSMWYPVDVLGTEDSKQSLKPYCEKYKAIEQIITQGYVAPKGVATQCKPMTQPVHAVFEQISAISLHNNSQFCSNSIYPIPIINMTHPKMQDMWNNI